MTALRWHARADVRLDEVPVPSRAPGEVLIEVSRVGLCGTDLEEYRDGPLDIPVDVPHPLTGRVAPITLGHEVVGVVVESDPAGPPVGTFVVPDVVVGCGVCWWCQRHEPGQCPRLSVRGMHSDGGLARFMVADAASCIPLPPDLLPDVAVFSEPAAVAVRAFRKAGDVAGAVLCVQGAGAVGTLLAQLALASTAAVVVVVDPDEGRRAILAAAGAACFSVEDAAAGVAALSGGRGADVVFECSGAARAPRQATAITRPGGTVVLVGFGPAELTVDWLPLVLGERRLIGSAAHVWDVDVRAAVSLIARGVLDPGVITSATVPLERAIVDGFERLVAYPRAPKILVDPTGGSA